MMRLSKLSILWVAGAFAVASVRAADPQLPGVAEAMKEQLTQEVAGAITMVVSRDKVLHFETDGFADLEQQRPMTEDTMFYIMSMTKPVTATAVLMLQDEGKLDVRDLVAKYIPEFGNLKTPAGKPANLTLLQVLTHTSGLGEAAGSNAKNAHTLADLVPLWLAAPMKFEPGSRWQYSQSGINTAARIVEIVSGESFSDFLRNHLFQPMGLKHTTHYPSEEQIPLIARPYFKNKTTGVLEAAAYPPTQPGLLPPTGNAGLYSTARDYSRFLQMLLNGGTLDGHQYLSPEALKWLSTPLTGDLPTGFFQNDRDGQYGLHYGWGIGTCILKSQHPGLGSFLSPGSFGHGGAWGTQAWVDPIKGRAYLLMVQRTNFPNSDASEPRKAFMQAATHALDGR